MEWTGPCKLLLSCKNSCFSQHSKITAKSLTWKKKLARLHACFNPISQAWKGLFCLWQQSLRTEFKYIPAVSWFKLISINVTICMGTQNQTCKTLSRAIHLFTDWCALLLCKSKITWMFPVRVFSPKGRRAEALYDKWAIPLYSTLTLLWSGQLTIAEHFFWRLGSDNSHIYLSILKLKWEIINDFKLISSMWSYLRQLLICFTCLELSMAFGITVSIITQHVQIH